MKSATKLMTITLLTAGALTFAGDMTAKKSLAIGMAAPMADVKMKNIAGDSLSIADAKGPKGTLVIFTCNHCPYVKAWEDRIAALGNQAKQDGLGVIAINSNDPSSHAEDGFDEMVTRAKEKGMNFAYVVDDTSGVARAFGATRTPEAFLFDANGKLAYHGAIDDNAEDAAAVKSHYLADAIGAVVAGKLPANKETKAVGCGIKFRS